MQNRCHSGGGIGGIGGNGGINGICQSRNQLCNNQRDCCPGLQCRNAFNEMGRRCL